MTFNIIDLPTLALMVMRQWLC